MEYQLYATCPDELTGLLANEIAFMGGTDVRTAYRVVYFYASKEISYRVHLHSRLASRIYRVLKEIPAHSPTIIFDKARRFVSRALFPSQAVGIKVVAAHDESPIPTHLIGSKLREAINDCFQHHLNVMPNQSSRDAVIGITGYFHHKRLMVSVDTSLESLHRRGFRVEGHPAPLKETLAAALLAVCEYDGTTPFFDPMCGSGTIVVEAAQMAINRAPGITGKKAGSALNICSISIPGFGRPFGSRRGRRSGPRRREYSHRISIPNLSRSPKKPPTMPDWKPLSSWKPKTSLRRRNRRSAAS